MKLIENVYSYSSRAGRLAAAGFFGLWLGLSGCAPISQIVQKEVKKESLEDLEDVKKAISKREKRERVVEKPVAGLDPILKSSDLQDGYLIPTEKARNELYRIIEELTDKYDWVKKIVGAQKERSNEVGGVLIPKAERESRRDLLKVLQEKKPLTESLHFKYDKEKKEFIPYFNQGANPKDFKLNPDDKVLPAFKVSDLVERVRTEEFVFVSDPSVLTDPQLKRLYELYRSAPLNEEKQIEGLVYGYFDKNPSLAWNVSIGLFAPDNKKANAGSTKYDNPRFEELTTPWANVKQYVSPKTIVEAASKIQERFTDTLGKPDIFKRVRSYLKARTGTVRDAVFGLLGKDRTIENGSYTIGQFFDGNTGNYEVSHVSVQVHRNKP